jgi:hypothetical protein
MKEQMRNPQDWLQNSGISGFPKQQEGILRDLDVGGSPRPRFPIPGLLGWQEMSKVAHHHPDAVLEELDLLRDLSGR